MSIFEMQSKHVDKALELSPLLEGMSLVDVAQSFAVYLAALRPKDLEDWVPGTLHIMGETIEAVANKKPTNI